MIEDERRRGPLRRRPGGLAHGRAGGDAGDHRRGGRLAPRAGGGRRHFPRERARRTRRASLRAQLEARLGESGHGYPARVKAEARVEFSLPARAENVPLVRHALAGLAEELGMGPGEVADLKTVVTEACTNVVVHAYETGQSDRCWSARSLKRTRSWSP